jgi:RNA polymerase sigma-70 factor (ECF subfamily)
MANGVHMHKSLKSRPEFAFNHLYDAYAPALYGLIIKVIPDTTIACDILQESFLQIWINIDSFDTSKGRLFNWMLGITVQQCSKELGLPMKVLMDKLLPIRNINV